MRTGESLVALALVTPLVAPGIVAANEVTIRAQVTKSRGVELEGTIASKAAGETVDVLAKDCGPAHREYRVVAGTRTQAGGVWRVTQEAGLPAGPSGSYFRARWQDHVSAPALVRYPAAVRVTWQPRRRTATVVVSTWFSGQSLRGRFVELQRRVEGTDQWVRVRRARLGRGRYSRRFPPGQVFKTQFSVPTRGLTLRVFIPERTAARCFSANVSTTWRS
jgi:hypothetical protein